MSEPIFRAWDNKNKVWVKRFFVANENGNVFERLPYFKIEPKLDNAIRLVDATLCRSTGLKDRNGVVIFEGDIVEFEPFNPDHCEGDYLPQQRFEVSLKRLRYWLTEECFGYEGELLLNSNDCEIIGNIFENPELLEQKQNG